MSQYTLLQTCGTVLHLTAETSVCSTVLHASCEHGKATLHYDRGGGTHDASCLIVNSEAMCFDCGQASLFKTTRKQLVSVVAEPKAQSAMACQHGRRAAAIVLARVLATVCHIENRSANRWTHAQHENMVQKQVSVIHSQQSRTLHLLRRRQILCCRHLDRWTQNGRSSPQNFAKAVKDIGNSAQKQHASDVASHARADVLLCCA